MRLYLSGPMSGLPDSNRPAFTAATKKLRAQGHSVVCPTELDFLPVPEEKHEAYRKLLWRTFIIRDVAMILTCAFDAVVVLPGWERSRGARMEVIAAVMIGLPILWAKDLKPVVFNSIDLGDLR